MTLVALLGSKGATLTLLLGNPLNSCQMLFSVKSVGSQNLCGRGAEGVRDQDQKFKGCKLPSSSQKLPEEERERIASHSQAGIQLIPQAAVFQGQVPFSQSRAVHGQCCAEP